VHDARKKHKNVRPMFERMPNCFSVYRNYTVVERPQNSISDAVIYLLINVNV